MGLFRQQAVDAQRDRLQGAVVLLPRLSHTLLSLGLLGWLALTTLFLTQASYSRKETVPGWLEPDNGIVKIYPQSEGRLAQLLVAEGERVAAGQPLAIINGDRSLTDGRQLENLLLQAYQQEMLALERQLERASDRGRRRAGELLQRRHNARLALEWLDRQLATLEQRQDIVEARSRRHRQLQRAGHVTQAELDSLREQALQLRAQAQALSLERVRAVDGLEQIDAERRQLPDEIADTRDLLQRQLNDLSREIARLRGNRAYVLKAGVAGTVSNIQLRPGQRARFEVPLMSVLPGDSELLAKLLVPARSAGFISAGQPLVIRIDAFPHQKFGVRHGRIVNVATSVSLAQESPDSPLPILEPVYRVEARLHSTRVRAYGEERALKAGMTLSADILLEDRSLLRWLLDPLLRLRGQLV